MERLTQITAKIPEQTVTIQFPTALREKIDLEKLQVMLNLFHFDHARISKCLESILGKDEDLSQYGEPLVEIDSIFGDEDDEDNQEEIEIVDERDNFCRYSPKEIPEDIRRMMGEL